jgi:hypothetical protein
MPNAFNDGPSFRQKSVCLFDFLRPSIVDFSLCYPAATVADGHFFEEFFAFLRGISEHFRVNFNSKFTAEWVNFLLAFQLKYRGLVMGLRHGEESKMKAKYADWLGLVDVTPRGTCDVK